MARITAATTARCASFRLATSTSCDRPCGPEVDQRIDVFGKRADGRHAQHVVEKHVALQRAHEEERRRARIAEAKASGGGGAAEVIDHERKSAARRAVRFIKGQYKRSAPRVSMHGHDDAGADDPRGEGNE